ncbi:MAG: histidine phosphatase family protein [Proteobacteria bacterium]|nr:histidine phosphatase family protein [Pseudomonadota bacterium]
MQRLYFIRHGETDWNRDGRLQGHIDIPLNTAGKRQAKAAGLHLDRLLGATSQALPFYVSPLGRTRETAEIVRETLHAPLGAVEEDARLKEINFGQWEGKTWPEIRSRDPAGVRGRDKDRWNFVPTDGESYAMVETRLSAWLATVQQDAIVVSHTGVCRVLMAIFGVKPPAELVTEEIWQGKVLVLEKGRAEWIPGPGHH